MFNLDLIKKWHSDPLPTQIRHEIQPVDLGETEVEYENDEILGRALTKDGEPGYIVKWSGHDNPTVEPEYELEETIALDQFLEKEKLSN